MISFGSSPQGNKSLQFCGFKEFKEVRAPNYYNIFHNGEYPYRKHMDKDNGDFNSLLYCDYKEWDMLKYIKLFKLMPHIRRLPE